MSYKSFRNRNVNKNKSTAAVAVSIAISVALLALAGLGFVMFGRKNTQPVIAGSQVQNPVAEPTDVSLLEMRGLWIASTINIDYPSKAGLTQKSLEKELSAIVEKADELGINSLFFQVRPACDALYDSDIFPASRYVSGTQGKTVSDFDSLRFLIDKAAEYNIDVHAWVNPYRVSMEEDEMDSLASTNPAKIHPEYTVKYADGRTYLNPGIPEVRSLVVSGVREIVEKYPDIAGIHFDDYFYPYPSGKNDFDDGQSYEMYGEGMEKADWRRNNVNLLVQQTYNTVKEINPECEFGVSVFGIWANKDSDTPTKGSDTQGLEAYTSLYCDALAWAKGGYVDYIAPQNYWSFDTEAAPFDDVARWWSANLDGTGVSLYMGHAAYKSGEYEEGEIYKQVEMCRTLSGYKGSIFYGYENITENIGSVADDIKKMCSREIYRKTAVSNGNDVKINYPSNNSYVDTSSTYIIGSCDPAYPLYFEGNAVPKTTDGYFSLFLPLEKGKNTYTFSQNGKTTEYVINRGKQNVYYSSEPAMLDSMEISAQYPSGTTWLSDGEKMTVSCVAPAGSNVTAKVGDTEIVLKPTIYPEGDGNGYLYEKYVGEINPARLVSSTDFKVLGNVEFMAQKDGEMVLALGGQVAAKGNEAYVYAEVKEDYTHTKVGTETSFYDDFLPSSKGMRDYVVDVTDGYCKMRFGGYIAEEQLEFTYGKPLLLNTILTTAVEVNAKNTVNNKQNSTDIRFGVTENIPVDVDFRGENGEMRIIIYNTDTSIIPQFDVPANPLIKSIEGRLGTRANMLMYYVTLKDENNFYGFNIVYENGCMIVKLNNPQTLADGDKPLLGKRIVVDAGHGGVDSGALGPGNKPEKVLNRNIAESLAQKLRNLGAEVVESRPGDETVDLYQRMDLLNAECPDLAISVHHNSLAGNANALKTKGFMALYSNNSGIGLSRTVSDVVCRELSRIQKPTAYQKLAVARNHRFPSTLVEMCFISNVEEYQWSITAGNAEKSADALVNGILEYYRNQEKYLDY